MNSKNCYIKLNNEIISMKHSIQFIMDLDQDAVFNMAADRYLLSHCVETQHIYIRLYSWNPPAISLGYMQKPDRILNREKCLANNIVWILRPTGGRAVFHIDDITYSVIFPKTISELGTSISKTYNLISRCLISGLQRIGIPCKTHSAKLNSAEARKEIKLPCFLAPNRDEIMVRGKKLVGSAQKRTHLAVLQHGSIPLTKQFCTLPLYQMMDKAESMRLVSLLANNCTCIEDWVSDYTRESVIANLVEGFAQNLPFDTKTKTWSQEDREKILEISQNFTVNQ